MSMPHAPPTPPTIVPIGELLDRSTESPGQVDLIVGLSLMAILILSLVQHAKFSDKPPLILLAFISAMMMIVLNLIDNSEKEKFITTHSLKRNYLARWAYRMTMSGGLLFSASYIFSTYSLHWLSLLIALCLYSLAGWNIRLPNHNKSYSGANNVLSYWRRITGKATFSQLDYSSGDTVRFSYEDGLTGDSDLNYHVFLQRIQEHEYFNFEGKASWEREVRWSAHQRASADLLSKGMVFPIPTDLEEVLNPEGYRLLYWEIILQEVNGSFQERFLLGVDTLTTVVPDRLEVLYDLPIKEKVRLAG